MGILPWIAENWFDLLSSVGIIGSLCFTAVALSSDDKSRRVGNLLLVTSNHREIWKELLRKPRLARVLNESADIFKKKITPEESEFVSFVILHLSSVFYAMKDDLLISYEGLQRDVAGFFNLPIPRAVWERQRTFQNSEFVKFVEECRKKEGPVNARTITIL